MNDDETTTARGSGGSDLYDRTMREAWHRDGLLGFGGLAIPYPGLAEAWLRIAPVGAAHPIKTARAVRRELIALVEEHKPRRVQALVIAGRDTGLHIRFLTWLGFRYEATLPLYGRQGETMFRYVLLFPHNEPTEETPL